MNNRGLTLPSLIIVGVIIVVVAAIIISKVTGKPNPVTKVTQKATSIVTGGSGFDFDENTPGYENYLELLQGCPAGKDCIPSIDNPEFESVSEANKYLEADDVVFVLDYKGVVRAYPQPILNRHEIVNDVVAGDPLAITFCPLCGSSLGFERTLDGQVLEFGVSGKLHQNDLVMFDRQTESLWQQITGEAIVGDLFGKRLKQVSLSGMRWSQYKEEFPNGTVLKGELSPSAYARYPYGDYESNPNPLFPMSNVDNTIHPKTVVYGVEVDDAYKAYQLTSLEKEGEIKDSVGGVDIIATHDNGNVSVRRTDTGEEVVVTRLFWFAWKAFRPETELY